MQTEAHLRDVSIKGSYTEYQYSYQKDLQSGAGFRGMVCSPAVNNNSRITWFTHDLAGLVHLTIE